MADDFKFDVAFSFLAQDEALATQLNDLLQSRLRTFLYSKRQETLAGTDGEQRFNSIFFKEARLVVVLYRAGWGQTPWTRIEETAIRNRAYDDGHEFVKFIPLDDPPKAPEWLPRAQIWIGLKRWGIPAAAGIIEARVQDLGGEPSEESVAEKAARVERSIKFSRRRETFLRSHEGVSAANSAFEAVKVAVQSAIASVSASTSAFEFKYKEGRREFVILGQGPALLVSWNYHFSNSLDDAHLEVTLWEGHPPFPGVYHFDQPRKLSTKSFDFDLLPIEECRWISNEREHRPYMSDELATYLLGYCIEQADVHKGRR